MTQEETRIETAIKDLFVSYKTANKLKEKGFNEPCLGYWVKKLDGNVLRYIWEEQLTTPILNSEDFRLAAPMYSQVVTWLLKKHKIHISVLLDGGTKFPCWRMYYDDMNKPVISNGVSVYFSDEIGAVNNNKTAWDVLIYFVIKNLI